MGQGHGDRLSTVDAAFLHMETPTQHMHVGGLFVFDAADADGFDYARFLELVRSRLHLVPRYRQKLAFAPFNLSAPAWVDDREFDLSYHVRHAALPRPGTTEQLMEYAARILSRPLDRDRPLWELYVIEGMSENRFAVLGKNHHAMIDGLAGIDIATVMLDVSPDPPDPIPDPEPWEPAPAPSGYELAWSGVLDLAASPRSLLDRVLEVAQAPRDTLKAAIEAAEGLVSFASSSLRRPAPPSPLNQPPGIHRRFAIERLALERFKDVKNAFDATVNDVVLAVVADATGRLLRARGIDTEGLWLRAMVPVSVRAPEDRHALGNRIVSVFVDLPMFEMDPAERLRVCHEAMQDVKEQHQAVGAGFLIGLAQFAPPTLHAMASRAASRSRLFNFLVTNVPGPQMPIYCLGARLLGAFPFAPLAATQSYAVGLTSIDGWMNFGFTGDYKAVPDLDDVPEHLVAALEELEASADAVDVRHELAQKPPTGELSVEEIEQRVAGS
ncbi:MAG: wax ester/triacylglycerol synthase family O-acyltransferase [Nitriliruptorales bacterium]|nr:wax ester/triacylglycerol synthase family O-acyltransferase [Nitriliruptorales bacterium]